MLKRFVCIFVAFILTLSLSILTIGDADVSYMIVEDDMLSNTAVAFSNSSKLVTVSEIQSLMDERSLALVAGDYECYCDITDKLREYGVMEISYEKLTELLSESDSNSLLSSSSETVTTSNSIFEYYYTTYTYGGVTYDIMRILASPNYNTQGNTILFSSGSKTLVNTKSSQAVQSLMTGNGVYESMVTSMPITGIEGQTVATARLSNPSYPLYAE